MTFESPENRGVAGMSLPRMVAKLGACWAPAGRRAWLGVHSWETRELRLADGLAPEFGGSGCQREKEIQVQDSREPPKF